MNDCVVTTVYDFIDTIGSMLDQKTDTSLRCCVLLQQLSEGGAHNVQSTNPVTIMITECF